MKCIPLMYPLRLRIIATLIEHTLQGVFDSTQPLIIAIDGRCAAGKTTLASILCRKLHVPVITMDHFFLRPEQRTAERLQKAGGNVDFERIATEVLDPLSHGRQCTYQPYNCHSQQMDEPITIAPAPVIIVEGSYSCHPTLRHFYAQTFFLTINSKTQLRRITKRNGAVQREVFKRKWIPLEELYFLECRIPQNCTRQFRT